MDTVAKNLGRYDRFYFLAAARRLIGRREPDPPSGRAEKVGNEIQIIHAPVHATGTVVKRTPADLDLNAWEEDQERYRALERRITPNWEYYNELLAQLSLMSGTDMMFSADRARIEQRVETVEAQLCSDFREMVSLDERVLRANLPDHYWLESICGPRNAPLV
jgi:hypothetical protein